jgi:RpiB/LacA/LacB family sugar-phosphate isomerase
MADRSIGLGPSSRVSTEDRENSQAKGAYRSILEASLKELSMRIVIGADHAGFELKQVIGAALQQDGHEVIDVGTHNVEPVDYPDYAAALGRAIVQGQANRGVLVCGSGVGASVSANKISGIRAGLCHDTYSAHQAVEHDDINVLVLGARVVGVALARELVDAFLGATFTAEERHQRRLEKVKALEQR